MPRKERREKSFARSRCVVNLPKVFAPRTTVVTVLERQMRTRLDAAAEGAFNTVHAESVEDAIRAVRERSSQTLLFSPSIIEADHLLTIGRLIVKCPGVVSVAVIGEPNQIATDEILRLGAHGVQSIVDLNRASDWTTLRNLVLRTGGETAAVILEAVIPILEGSTEETRRFFDAMIRSAPTVTTVRAFARTYRVLPSTMMSRFFRARLPSPKVYLASARLLHASAFLRVPGRSFVDVAYGLAYSSPQSFGRHVRLMLGVSASEFRQEQPFPVAVQHFISRLIVPHRRIFQWFDPFGRMMSADALEVARLSDEDAKRRRM